ncbi:MAG: TlpA family protein disulfide reductase [Anaerolineae bacterium]
MRRSRWLWIWLVGLLWVSAGCQSPTSTPVVADATAETPTPTPRPPAPDFTLETLQGETLQLADYRGQVVLVNFWASWCPPCQEEMPTLEAYYQAHKDEAFVIIGVNVKDSPDAVNAFLEDHSVSFPLVLDREAKVAGAYNVTGLPTSFFVDREGRMMGFWPGMVTRTFLENNLTQLLEE